MSYSVREVFATLQGEGINTGRRACFVRFAGCNLWSGIPGEHRDKGKGACAKWCDTEFRNGTKMDAAELETAMDMAYPQTEDKAVRLCVLTGGEPLLQVDLELVDLLHSKGWEIALETNGTVNPHEVDRGLARIIAEEVDHVAVSPKLMAEGDTRFTIAIDPQHVTELKVVLPGHVDVVKGWRKEELKKLAETFDQCAAYYVQPMDPIDPAFVEVTVLKTGAEDGGIHAGFIAQCLDFVAANPLWRVGLQTHKFMGLK